MAKNWDDSALSRLRAALHQADGVGVVNILRGRPLAEVLQFAGGLAVGRSAARRWSRGCG